MKTLIAISLAFVVNAASAKDAPKVLEENMGCPGVDCCVTGMDWKVTKDGKLTSKPDGKSTKTKVKSGDTVKALATLTRSERGEVVTNEDRMGKKAGETLAFYSTGYEDYTVKYWTGEGTEDSGYTDQQIQKIGKLKKASKAETFVKIKTVAGKEGWLPLAKLEPSC